ncbi:MAG: ArsC/Spx/MgsR family protein [Pseudomonadota bacterium]
MAHMIFYEKPGCISNTRQKKLLTASGHTLEVRNLLKEPWTPEALRPFFADMAVADWFNTSAPAVKSGEIAPQKMTEDQALAVLSGDPILIRRPLMQVGEDRRAGFDQDAVDAWIGLQETDKPVTDTCPKEAANSEA